MFVYLYNMSHIHTFEANGITTWNKENVHPDKDDSWLRRNDVKTHVSIRDSGMIIWCRVINYVNYRT